MTTSTHGPLSTLTARSFSAAGWRSASVAQKFIVQLSLGVLLARLLGPSSFGVVAQATLVITLASVVSELGMAAALVQRADLTTMHIRAAFTLSTLTGLFFATVLFLGAPLAGTFFRTAEVVPILRLLSATFLLGSVGTAAEAMLRRKLDFRSIFVVDLVAQLVGYGAIGAGLALAGFGAWALAWAAVARAAIRSISFLALAHHNVRPAFHKKEISELLRFGMGTSLARLFNYAGQNGDFLVLGRMLGPRALGLYSRGFELMVVPTAEFAAVISSVAYPAYSAVQDNPDRMKRAYFRTITLATLGVFPTLAGMWVAAPELIRGVYGAQWADVIPIFQILCLGGGFRAVYHLGDALARAKGAVYSQAIRHAAYAIAVVLGSYFAVRYGTNGVAWAVVGALTMMYLITGQLCLDLTNAKWSEFLYAQLPGALIAGCVFITSSIAAYLLRRTVLGDLPILGILIVVCAATALAALSGLRGRAMGEVPEWAWSYIRHMLPRRRVAETPTTLLP